MAEIKTLPLDPDLSIGIDIGIGSCAVAALRPGTIEALHVRCFPIPETADKKELLNAIRRRNRLMRRQTHRRRRRRNDLARLLAKYLPLTLAEIKARDAHDPWLARAKGLEEQLSAGEFASALMHIAKRRGFRSNSKRLASGNDPEGGKALKGVAAMAEKAQRYKTVGEMLFRAPEFAEKKRNRPGDYSHTVARAEMRSEVEVLFAAQRRLSSKFAGQG